MPDDESGRVVIALKYIVRSGRHCQSLIERLPACTKRKVAEAIRCALDGAFAPFGLEFVACPAAKVEYAGVVEWGIDPGQPLERGSADKRGQLRAQRCETLWSVAFTYQAGGNGTRYRYLVNLPRELLTDRVPEGEVFELITQSVMSMNAKNVAKGKMGTDSSLRRLSADNLVTQGEADAARAVQILAELKKTQLEPENTEEARMPESVGQEQAETLPMEIVPARPLYLIHTKTKIRNEPESAQLILDAVLLAQNGDQPASTVQILDALVEIHPAHMRVQDGGDRPTQRELIRVYGALTELVELGKVVKSGNSPKNIRWKLQPADWFTAPDREEALRVSLEAQAAEVEEGNALVNSVRRVVEGVAKYLEFRSEDRRLEEQERDLTNQLEALKLQRLVLGQTLGNPDAQIKLKLYDALLDEMRPHSES